MEPILVIVGFLGAGKTTLLKSLVKDYLSLDWDPFVILNDYQNARLDSEQFLSFLTKEQISALSGSCICCSGVNELRTLVNDIPKREKGITIIEANGTTDATTLMEFLGVGIKETFFPPVQVSVVDCRYFGKREEHNELERNQVTVSSLIILNFANEVPEERLQEVKSSLNAINPSAKLIEWEKLEAQSLFELKATANQYEKIDHLKSHWSSCSVPLPDPMDKDKLLKVIGQLPSGIIRVKGCTRFNQESVYTFFETTPDGEIHTREYHGDLVSGPTLLTVGPGSHPETIEKLIQNS